MAFWNDAIKKMQDMVQQRAQQQPEKANAANRDDGGFSGYTPKVTKRRNGPNGAATVNGAPAMGGVGGMMPPGVDPQSLNGYGARPMARGPKQPGPAMNPQQPFGTAQQPPVGWQGTAQQPFNQAQPVGPTQPVGQQMPPQQPLGQAQPMGAAQPPFAGAQTAQQPNAPWLGGVQMPQQPPQEQGHTFHFPGDYVTPEGGYKLVFRVAQITGVSSCFRVIEFMHNGEAVVVNAEMITDAVEANRCMDLIFGASCAFGQRLIRVSGRQIYLITPPTVRVEPFEGILRSGMEDIDRRWPGARQMNMPQMGGAQQPQPMGFTSQMQDFVPGGRRASRSANQGNYTDYGGFGVRR